MKPAALSFGFGKAFLLVGAFVGLICGAVACADAEGTTPDCVQDVGEGADRNAANGCNPFAVCKKNPSNPAACCADDKGAPLPGIDDVAACIYGYGGDVPTGGAGGGGGK